MNYCTRTLAVAVPQAIIAEGERRGDAAVGTSEVVHKPSDVEVALRCLATRLRGLRGLSAAAGALLLLVFINPVAAEV